MVYFGWYTLNAFLTESNIVEALKLYRHTGIFMNIKDKMSKGNHEVIHTSHHNIFSRQFQHVPFEEIDTHCNLDRYHFLGSLANVSNLHFLSSKRDFILHIQQEVMLTLLLHSFIVSKFITCSDTFLKPCLMFSMNEGTVDIFAIQE